MYKGISINLKVDLSTEMLQARREWAGHTYSNERENPQSRLHYPAKISFRFEGDITNFRDKQKLREFGTTKQALEQMLKEFLQTRNTKRRCLQKKKQQ